MSKFTGSLVLDGKTIVVTYEDGATEYKLDAEVQEPTGEKILGVGGGRPKCPK